MHKLTVDSIKDDYSLGRILCSAFMATPASSDMQSHDPATVAANKAAAAAQNVQRELDLSSTSEATTAPDMPPSKAPKIKEEPTDDDTVSPVEATRPVYVSAPDITDAMNTRGIAAEGGPIRHLQENTEYDDSRHERMNPPGPIPRFPNSPAPHVQEVTSSTFESAEHRARFEVDRIAAGAIRIFIVEDEGPGSRSIRLTCMPDEKFGAAMDGRCHAVGISQSQARFKYLRSRGEGNEMNFRGGTLTRDQTPNDASRIVK